MCLLTRVISVVTGEIAAMFTENVRTPPVVGHHRVTDRAGEEQVNRLGVTLYFIFLLLKEIQEI